MKKRELKKMDKDELKIKLLDSQEAIINLRFQKALQQLEHPQKIKLMRREIAQIKTKIREFELEEGRA